MQNVYYIDRDFYKENSLQYFLSIRYSTDGLSFCVHDSRNNRLLVFFFQPFYLENQSAVIEKLKQLIEEDQILNLRYLQVFLLPCQKEKMLVPGRMFNPKFLPELYQVCFPLPNNAMLNYREIKAMDSYLVESLPDSLLDFLKNRYSSLVVANSAVLFIKHSLANIGQHRYHLFIDLHHQYFDLLLTQGTEVLLFNSFSHHSISDIVYYSLNCLEQCDVNLDELKTICSGNLVNEPGLTEVLGKYMPHFSLLSYSPLCDLIPDQNLNFSSFIHLLNIHQCEL